MDLMIAYSPTLMLLESYVAIYKLYTLRNPFTKEVFYVGQTKMSLSTRLSGHISGSESNKAKNDYIQSIVDQNEKPIIEEIETIAGTCYIDKLFVNDREIFWVKYYKSRGVKLLNSAIMSDEAECKDYKHYLASIKAGQGHYKYYYCGKTPGGHQVYDEKRMKADGFRLPTPSQPAIKIVEKVVYKTIKEYITVFEKQATVKTETFPPQLAWTSDFADSIPCDEICDPFDFEEDMSDFEPDTSDYEPDADFEPEEEEPDEDCEDDEREVDADYEREELENDESAEEFK